MTVSVKSCVGREGCVSGRSMGQGGSVSRNFVRAEVAVSGGGLCGPRWAASVHVLRAKWAASGTAPRWAVSAHVLRAKWAASGTAPRWAVSVHAFGAKWAALACS